jgi:uncharacterized membrane-anchored protein
MNGEQVRRVFGAQFWTRLLFAVAISAVLAGLMPVPGPCSSQLLGRLVLASPASALSAYLILATVLLIVVLPMIHHAGNEVERARRARARSSTSSPES